MKREDNPFEMSGEESVKKLPQYLFAFAAEVRRRLAFQLLVHLDLRLTAEAIVGFSQRGGVRRGASNDGQFSVVEPIYELLRAGGLVPTTGGAVRTGKRGGRLMPKWVRSVIAAAAKAEGRAPAPSKRQKKTKAPRRKNRMPPPGAIR